MTDLRTLVGMGLWIERFGDIRGWRDDSTDHNWALTEADSILAAFAGSSALKRAKDPERKVRAAERLHVWQNEDGRRFVFADDLADALEIPRGAPHG